jgi:glycerol-3-phosphate acyltransferase PlsY
MASAAIVWCAAYLIGSIPFGWLIARARGVDIFKEGSGNIGATNIGRVLGKPLGLLVFLLDFAKGAGPVALATLAAERWELPLWPGTLEVGAGLAAFLGHCFPIYLRFRGGKGVATATGVVAVLVPLPALAGLLTFVAVLTATRYVSLACLVADVVLVGLHLVRPDAVPWTDPRTAFLLVATALVFLRHRGNISRLRAGAERQVHDHPALEPTARSLHVLALGLWCGMGVFFSWVAAPALFANFEEVGRKPADERPIWFPLPAAFEASDQAFQGPKEQGVRAAGFVVGGIFPAYFLIQFLCGAVAFGTALGWPRWRLGIIGLAFALVIIGWPIEHKVTALRPSRNEATDAFLQAEPSQREEFRPAMLAARKEFAAWHVVSLLTDMVVVGLVIIALALAGNLPKQQRIGPVDRA